jgi:hypothetical protein
MICELAWPVRCRYAPANTLYAYTEHDCMFKGSPAERAGTHRMCMYVMG